MVRKFVYLLEAAPEKSGHVLDRAIYVRLDVERISEIVLNSFLCRGSGRAFGARGLVSARNEQTGGKTGENHALLNSKSIKHRISDL
jgi:hypothetical protein